MKRVQVPYDLLLILIEQAEEAAVQLQIHVGGPLAEDLAAAADTVRHFMPVEPAN